MNQTDYWRIRQAQHIAAQLPQEPEEARAVLDYVEQMINFPFIRPPSAPSGGDDRPGSDNQVLSFPGGSKRPRRRASAMDRLLSIFPQ
jgi:hypothetical protein